MPLNPGPPRMHRESQSWHRHGCKAAREVIATGTQTEGTHHLGSTHTKGAHPQLPTHPVLGTVSLTGTVSHSLPMVPTVGEILTL